MDEKYVQKGTLMYKKINLAFFLAGFTIFAVLYSVQPLLPMFTSVYRIDATGASLVLSITTISLSVAMLFYGAISETIGRKPVMVFSVITVSILSLIQPFCEHYYMLLFVRLMLGICLAGLPAIAMAYISEEIIPSGVPSAIGLYISGNAFGGAFGRIFTGYIASQFGHQVGLISIGIISCVATICFVILLPPSKHFVSEPFNIKVLMHTYRQHLLNKSLLKPFMLGSLFMAGNIALMNYIAFELTKSPYNIDDSYISFIYILFLLGMVSSITSGKIIEDIGKIGGIKASIILFMIGTLCTLLPFTPLKILGIAMTIYAFFSGHSMASAVVGQNAKDHKSQVTSLYLLFYYFGTSIGGTVGGIFYSMFGWIGVVFMTLILMMIAYAMTHSMNDKKRFHKLRILSHNSIQT